MKNQTLTLAYLNEDDRAYGLAGMVISLASLHASDRIAEVHLDSDGPMVEFAHEYYFPGSPALSPKTVWDNLVTNFHLTTSMVLSNILARSLVRMKENVPEDIMTEIYKEVEREGRDTCALEEDEIEHVYNNAMLRMKRIFNNPRLHPAVDEFAKILSRRRSMSGLELRDELHMLQLI